MSTRPPRGARYGGVAIAFHWTVAALILGNLALGLWQDRLEGLERYEIIQVHKSIGITVLVLSVLRLAWRLGHRPPPLPGDHGAAARRLAHAVHWAFYALIIALPLTGWLMVSASPLNIPTLLYGWVPWPHMPGVAGLDPAARLAVAGRANTAHELLTYVAYLLIALHVAAALKHQFVDRDGVLWRMAPLSSLRPRKDIA